MDEHEYEIYLNMIEIPQEENDIVEPLIEEIVS